MNERNLAAQVVTEVKKAIVGKDAVLVKVLAAVLARGHILLEDIPGVGKTTLALAFAKALNLQFSRVQFTPDVMPSDITGFSIYNKETGKMTYQPGAVMCNLFLADELNRATSRTQSALLEAMEEGQVTVDGVSRPVPQPFMVIATQNPIEEEGTFNLPEAQMDRFMMKAVMTYPTAEQEVAMLALLTRRGSDTIDPTALTHDVISIQDVDFLCRTARQVHVSDAIMKYAVDLSETSRGAGSKPVQGLSSLVRLGASPRASIALVRIGQAAALMAGRNYVVPEDIKQYVHEVLRHRVLLTFEALADGVTCDQVIDSIVKAVPVP